MVRRAALMITLFVEAFHASLKKEEVYPRAVYQNYEEAKLSLFQYVEGFIAREFMPPFITKHRKKLKIS
jgi:hypothetical protein